MNTNLTTSYCNVLLYIYVNKAIYCGNHLSQDSKMIATNYRLAVHIISSWQDTTVTTYRQIDRHKYHRNPSTGLWIVTVSCLSSCDNYVLFWLRLQPCIICILFYIISFHFQAHSSFKLRLLFFPRLTIIEYYQWGLSPRA